MKAMGETTAYAQCIECGRAGSVGRTWFYMNSWGPICGLCWYKLTGRQAPRDEVDIREIVEKCEQYWNEPHIGAPEVHAILEFIHERAKRIMVGLEGKQR